MRELEGALWRSSDLEIERHNAHHVDRLTRGRDLTLDEIRCMVADAQTPIRHGTAEPIYEAAELLLTRFDGAALATTEVPPDARYTVTVKDEETGAVRDVYHLDADSIALLTGAPARDEPGIDPERLARAMTVAEWPPSIYPAGYGDPRWQRDFAASLAAAYRSTSTEDAG